MSKAPLFVVYPGLEGALLLKNVGIHGINGAFTYVTGADYEYKVNAGLNLPDFRKLWIQTYANMPGTEFGQNAVAGYTVGIILQETLAHTVSLEQMALRDAVFGLSGQITTISGLFRLDDTGAQIGEIMPLGQVEPQGQGGMKLVVVYPPDLATGTARLD